MVELVEGELCIVDISVESMICELDRVVRMIIVYDELCEKKIFVIKKMFFYYLGKCIELKIIDKLIVISCDFRWEKEVWIEENFVIKIFCLVKKV